MNRLIIIPSVTKKFSFARSFSNNATGPIKTAFKWSEFQFNEKVGTVAMSVGGGIGTFATGYSTYQENGRKPRRVQITKTVCGAVAGGTIGAAIGLISGYFWFLSIPTACAVYVCTDLE